MARVLNDLILYSTSDPVLKISVPANLKNWIQEAAAYRETTVQQMIADMLFDRFHHVQDVTGQYRKLNNLEKTLRTHSFWRNQDAKCRAREKAKVKLKPIPLTAQAKAANKQHTWAAYTKLRAANIRLLEQQEFALARRVPALRRTSAELEELSAKLDARGITAVKILVDGRQTGLRPEGYRSGTGRNQGVYSKEAKSIVVGSTRDFSEAEFVYREVRAKYEVLDTEGDALRAEKEELAAKRLAAKVEALRAKGDAIRARSARKAAKVLAARLSGLSAKEQAAIRRVASVRRSQANASPEVKARIALRDRERARALRAKAKAFDANNLTL